MPILITFDEKYIGNLWNKRMDEKILEQTNVYIRTKLWTYVKIKTDSPLIYIFGSFTVIFDFVIRPKSRIFNVRGRGITL